jgi:hypothetical protein
MAQQAFSGSFDCAPVSHVSTGSTRRFAQDDKLGEESLEESVSWRYIAVDLGLLATINVSCQLIGTSQFKTCHPERSASTLLFTPLVKGA